MKQIVLLSFLCALCIGCGDSDSPNRRRRRDRDNPSPIVDPIDKGDVKKEDSRSLASAQKAQARARADAFRECAKQFTDGTMKTVWDAKKTFTEMDKAGRIAFEASLANRLQKEFNALNPSDDNLVEGTDKMFEKLAKELDTVTGK